MFDTYAKFFERRAANIISRSVIGQWRALPNPFGPRAARWRARGLVCDMAVGPAAMADHRAGPRHLDRPSDVFLFGREVLCSADRGITKFRWPMFGPINRSPPGFTRADLPGLRRDAAPGQREAWVSEDSAATRRRAFLNCSSRPNPLATTVVSRPAHRGLSESELHVDPTAWSDVPGRSQFGGCLEFVAPVRMTALDSSGSPKRCPKTLASPCDGARSALALSDRTRGR